MSENKFKSVDDAFNEVIKLYNQGMPANADSIHIQILNTFPKDAALRNRLAQVALLAGHLALAIELFREAVEILPQMPELQFNLARAYEAIGNPDAAILSYQKALALRPDYRECLVFAQSVGCYLLERNRLGKTPPITPMPPANSESVGIRERLYWFEKAKRFLQGNRIEGAYLEFGSHDINTFRQALNIFGQYGLPPEINHYYAFDSFQGMPEPLGIDQQKIWRTGMNYTSLVRFYDVCRLDLHRITAVRGFFNKSLPNYQLPPGTSIAVAYIDVDYYSSTVDVLSFLDGKLKHGSIIVFDDWNCYYADPNRGQRKAFREFKNKLRGVARFEPFVPIGGEGMSFIYQECSKLGQAVL